MTVIIKSERQLSCNGKEDCRLHQTDNFKIKPAAVFLQKDKCAEEKKRNDVFAAFFKRCQADIFLMAYRENWPDKNCSQENEGDSQIKSQHLVRLYCATKKKKGYQQGNAFDISGRYPKLRGDIVGDRLRKDVHLRITQTVEQIQKSGEQAGNAEKKETLIALHLPGVPSKDENRAGDGCAEDFSEGMKKEVVVQADQIQAQRSGKQSSAGQGQRM